MVRVADDGRVARESCPGTGRVTRYWCMRGTIGRSTPAIAATRGAHCPEALTTCSARIGPAVVSTPWTRPRPSRRIPVTRVAVRISAPDRRTPRQLSRDGVGLHVAVAADVDGALQPGGAHRGKDAGRLGGPDHLRLDAEGPGPADAPPERLEHGRTGREPQASDRPPARRLTQLVPQPPVERHAGPHQGDVSWRGSELGHQAYGVERGAAGELALLQKDHVTAPRRREVVGDAVADDATADHDDRGVGPHRPPPAAVPARPSPRPGRARRPARRRHRRAGREWA